LHSYQDITCEDTRRPRHPARGRAPGAAGGPLVAGVARGQQRAGRGGRRGGRRPAPAEELDQGDGEGRAGRDAQVVARQHLQRGPGHGGGQFLRAGRDRIRVTGQDQGRGGDQPDRDGLAVQGLGLGREREAVAADVVGEGPEPARADADDGRRVVGPQRVGQDPASLRVAVILRQLGNGGGPDAVPAGVVRLPRPAVTSRVESDHVVTGADQRGDRR
jgi:hypothetical protein